MLLTQVKNMIYTRFARMILPLFAVLLLCNSVTSFDMAQGVYNFSVDLFLNAYSQNDNCIMSPLSAQIVLGLAYAGAAGPTAQAMSAALDFGNETQQEAINDLSALMNTLTKVDNSTTLNIANKIYVNNSYQLNSTFEAAAEQLDSGVETIDFTDSTDAANSINAWAAAETDNNIQNLVTPSDLGSQTSLVLLNAIFFKGTWKTQFSVDQTNPYMFYTSKTTTQQIPMMNIKSKFNYGDYIANLPASAIQLPYTDPDLSMLFILPHSKTGLTSLLNSFVNTDINSILNGLYNQEVIVKIPKFTINSNYNFNNALTTLGMGIIFGGEANFEGMVTKVPNDHYLGVSAVAQKAFIEINEQGAKAAAVTGIFFPTFARPGPPPPPTPEFIADHPFVFMLLKNNDVLFMGTFVKLNGASITTIASTPPGSSGSGSSSVSSYSSQY